MRHPQYAGFVLIMFGFLVQWPTILTLVMFPILVWMYVRLARHEEADSRARFGSEWDSYAGRVPAFVPSRLTSDRQAGNGGQRSTKNSERE
jgi:protein-S-isoprenylcysteine O-methyltransferase Ste14